MPREIQISCLKSHSKGKGERALESRKFHSRGESYFRSPNASQLSPYALQRPKFQGLFLCFSKINLNCVIHRLPMIPWCQCWEGDTCGTWRVNYN